MGTLFRWALEPAVKFRFIIYGAILLGVGFYYYNTYVTGEMLKHSRASVVRIQASNSLGSGFFISIKGLIVTAEHVTRGSEEIKFMRFGNGEWEDAHLLAEFPQLDIAFFEPDDKKFKTEFFLRLGDSDALNLGDRVYAIGHPGSSFWMITEGMVNYLSYTKLLTPMQTNEHRVINIRRNTYVLYATPHITHGVSGGPLVNSSGYVVGMAVRYSYSTRAPSPGHTNIFMPSNTILRLMGN